MALSHNLAKPKPYSLNPKPQTLKGVALSLNLAKQGLSVAMIGPIEGGWPNNYGVWMDEWDALGLPLECIQQTYASTRITISADESIGIDRAYGKVGLITSPQLILNPQA